MRNVRFLILTCITLLSWHCYAQRYEVGIAGMGTGYMGDINPQNQLYIKSLGGGIFSKYNFSPTWGARLSVNYLHLQGQDRDFDNELQNTRNLSFQNRITEFSLMGEFNFYTIFNKKRQQTPNFTPYIFAGIGILNHDPYVRYGGQRVRLNPLRLEYDEISNPTIYSTWNMLLPFGVGIKHNLKNSWAIGAEISYRLAFTDNLDNVSKYYATSIPQYLRVPNVEIKDGDVTRKFGVEDWEYLADPSGNLFTNAGLARGDGKTKDGYMTIGITLTYSILSTDCFSWRK